MATSRLRPGARPLALLLALLLPAAGRGGEPSGAPESMRVPEAPVLLQRFSAGAMGALSLPTEDGDLDLLLSERLRWEPLRRPGLRLRILADGRASFDLLGRARLTAAWSAVQWVRVRRLGVELESPAVTLQVGRHPVWPGGFRLVDGVQVVTRPRPAWELGLWAGLAPDMVTTMPALRFGGGPVVALTLSWLQASLVGEILGIEGALDRAGGLLQVRLSADPGLELYARLDMQVPDGDGGSSLVDAAAVLRVRPHRSLLLEAMYDAYGSHRYLASTDRDPAIRRFALRAEASGLTSGVPQDSLDPTIHHLASFSARWTPGQDRASPRPELGLDLRYRHHEEEMRRFARATGRAGLLGIGGRLDLLLSGGWLYVDRTSRGEVGLSALLELGERRMAALDAQARLTMTRDDDGGTLPGLYGDLFLDVSTPHGLTISAGVFGEGLLLPEGWDTSVGGMARVAVRLRLKRVD